MKQYCIEASIIEWNSETNERKPLPDEKKMGIAMFGTLEKAKTYLNDLIVEEK